MKKTYALWLLCLACLPLSAQSADTLVWQNLPRTYLLYLPAGYNSAQTYPLVVACHPGLSNAAQHADVARWQLVGDTAGFITVYPNGMPSVPNGNTRLWNAYNQPSAVADYDDVGFLNALLDRLTQQYAVDTCRGTIDSLNRRFWSDFLTCAGSAIDTLQATGETIVRERFTGCAADFEFCTVLGNGHQWHAPATPLFWYFFKQHSKCSVATKPPKSARRDGLHVYPNPADDEVLIRYDGPGDFTMTLLDATGRTVFQGKNATRIDVSGRAPGMYFLVWENDGYRESRRIVLR